MATNKIMKGPWKWVVVMPDGRITGLTAKPKKIPGGYMDENGHRYISNPLFVRERVRLVENNWDAL